MIDKEKLARIAELADSATRGPYKLRAGSADERGSGILMFIQAPRSSEDHPYDIELFGEDVHEDLYPEEQREADMRLHAELDPATVAELVRGYRALTSERVFIRNGEPGTGGTQQEGYLETTDLQKAFGDWADKAFPKQNLNGIKAHLEEEVGEFLEAFDPEEAADCFLLILHYAHKCQYPLLQFDAAAFKRTFDLFKIQGNLGLAQSLMLQLFLAGFNHHFDLMHEGQKKFRKCMKRKWPDEPNEDGYYKHVKEGEGGQS